MVVWICGQDRHVSEFVLVYAVERRPGYKSKKNREKQEYQIKAKDASDAEMKHAKNIGNAVIVGVQQMCIDDGTHTHDSCTNAM